MSMRRIKRDKPNSGRVGHAASHEASKDPARSEREPASDPGFATRPEANEPLNQRLDRIQDSIPYESQLNTRSSPSPTRRYLGSGSSSLAGFSRFCDGQGYS
jgi:hypothetical protein